MKKRKRVLSKRLFYTLMFTFVLVFAGVSVYALSAGSTENPGHNINSIGAPSDCANGQFLQWNWNYGHSAEDPAHWEWICTTPPTITTGITLPTCTSPSKVLKMIGGVWGCGTDIDTDTIGLHDYEVINSQNSVSSYSWYATCPTGKILLSGSCSTSGNTGLIKNGPYTDAYSGGASSGSIIYPAIQRWDCVYKDASIITASIVCVTP